MTKLASQVEFVNELAFKLRDLDLIHLIADSHPMPDRRMLHLSDRPIHNFTSCSYLGLETHPLLKEAAKKAIDDYGINFYVSRAYISLNMYEELESLFEQMFGNEVVIMPTTALGHWAALPVLIGDGDAVILDHQVHTSVQMATKIVKTNGAHVEMIRHNRMDYLESRIKKLSSQYNKIWYLADGVYSMYGDVAPMDELHQLLEKYDNFHLYIDDAHGMSWTGKNGAGYVMSQGPLHPRMVLITSMGKAFGTSGAVAVFNDNQMKEKVRNCGSTLIFTGPLQPPTLAASIASAKIHLSDEINVLQNALSERIRFFDNKAAELGLPIIEGGKTPVFYLGTGKVEVAQNLTNRLKNAGFLTCIAVFPSVPYHRAGLRLLSTVHNEFEDIELLLETVAEELPKALRDENFSMEQIHNAFEINLSSVDLVTQK